MTSSASDAENFLGPVPTEFPEAPFEFTTVLVTGSTGISDCFGPVPTEFPEASFEITTVLVTGSSEIN